MSTCETCKHAQDIDPKGTWRPRYGVVWHTTHVHCGLQPHPRTHVIAKCKECTFSPSAWAPKDVGYPDIATYP